MHNPGTMALDDGARVDFGRMRRERLDRCLAEMERRGLDALILGREGNAKYVAGARRLFVAGTRPFGPGCVVVASTRNVHLLTVWDDGIPPEIPREHLFGLSWNPMNILASVAALPGLAEARRVGVDSMSPLFEQLLPMVLPNAELVDGEGAMRTAREVKTADEIGCIRTAVALGEACLAAAIGAIRPGVNERTLVGTFGARMAGLGVTTPAREGTFCMTPRGADGPRLRRVTADVGINDGDLVACSSGVLYAGYEGTVGRTWPCLSAGRTARPAQRALFGRWRDLWEAVADALRPGASGADVRKAYEATGEPLPPFPVARGVGLGYEAPVIGTSLGADADGVWTLTPGMTLAVGAYVWEEGVGGVLGEEVVLITDDGHEVLTRLAHGPLAEAD
jgi:Xaa-Pro aminopeptidase